MQLSFLQMTDSLISRTDNAPGIYFQEVTPPTPVQNKSSPGDKNGDNYADGD